MLMAAAACQQVDLVQLLLAARQAQPLERRAQEGAAAEPPYRECVEDDPIDEQREPTDW